MSEMEELEGRIAAALERVSRGVETLGKLPDTQDTPAVDEDLVARLREALEAERTANAQLEERVRAIHERQNQQVEAVNARADEAEAEAERLREVNRMLRETNRALREANAQGLGDATAINAALQAELEALRVLRDGDRAELDGIIAELEPLTGEEANA